eukprot:gene46143-61698_t
MEIVWNQTAQSFWDAAHAAQGGAMQQDWAYGESLAALGIPCYRAQVSRRGEVIALAQFVCRRYAWTVGFALCTRGPIWLRSLDPVEQAAVYRALKRSLPMAGPRFALFSPDIVDTGHLSVRKLFRVLTGYSTVRIDLTQSAEARRAAMEGRWRNRLVASERAGIQIKMVLRGGAAEQAGFSAGDEWLGLTVGTGKAATRWRLNKLDDVLLYAGTATKVSACVARDQRLLELPLVMPRAGRAFLAEGHHALSVIMVSTHLGLGVTLRIQLLVEGAGVAVAQQVPRRHQGG